MGNENQNLWIFIGILVLILLVVLTMRHLQRRCEEDYSCNSEMSSTREHYHDQHMIQTQGAGEASSEIPQGLVGLALPTPGTAVKYITVVDNSGNQSLKIVNLTYDTSNNLLSANAKGAYNIVGGGTNQIVIQDASGNTNFINGVGGNVVGYDSNGKPSAINPNTLTVSNANYATTAGTANQLASNITIPSGAFFAGPIPLGNGTGSVPVSALSNIANYTGNIGGNFTGNIGATQITSGTIDAARLPTITVNASSLSGTTLPTTVAAPTIFVTQG